MADTIQVNGKASALVPVNNRMSTRSTRKRKTTMLSPKKFVDSILMKSGKSFEAGVAEFYKETYLESPTFFAFFKSPKEKNASEEVWLYDSTRVMIPEVEYYHASWVDGLKPNQYILAQAPRDANDAKDFFKILSHVKAEGIIIAEGADEFSSVISSKFEKGVGKKKGCSADKEDIASAIIKEHGVNLKAIKFTRWTTPNTLEKTVLMDLMQTARTYLGCPLTKGPLVIVCKDGATKSGVVAFLEMEMTRLEKHKRIKHVESIKLIRSMRSNTFDSPDIFNLALDTLLELCRDEKSKLKSTNK